MIEAAPVKAATTTVLSAADRLMITLHLAINATDTHLKLLSSSRMSDASFAIDVPAAMAKPTSAALSAGASFVPSPVTAIVSISSPRARNAFTACWGGDIRCIRVAGGATQSGQL